MLTNIRLMLTCQQKHATHATRELNPVLVPNFHAYLPPKAIAMTEGDFERILDDYRKNAYTNAVEDFVTAFELCEFHSDELLFALADAFKKRGFAEEVATQLEGLAQSMPLDENGNASFRAIPIDSE